MPLPRVLSAARRYLVVLVVLALVGAVGGAAIELSRPSAYVGTIRLFANQGKADSTPVAQSPSLAVARMTTFVKLANSTALADRLISALDLPDDATDLSSRITASLDPDTVILTVAVSAQTQDGARTIAEAVPAQYTDLVNSLAGLSRSDANATVLTTFDGPVVAPTRSVRRIAASALLGAVIALSLGLAVVLARERRRSARAPQVLAAVTGLPVLGILPRSEPGGAEVWIGPVDEEQRLSCHRLARNLPMLLDGGRRLVVVTTPRNPEDSLQVSLGLAGALAQRGDSVLLIDAGRALRGVAATLDLGAIDPERSLSPPRRRGSEGDAEESVNLVPREVPSLPGLLLATVGTGGAELASGRSRHDLAAAIRVARDHYDAVIVNAAPVLSRSDVPTAIEDADAVLLVVDQFGTPLEDCAAATASLRAMSGAGSGLVVHRADIGSMSSAQYLSGVVTVGSGSAF